MLIVVIDDTYDRFGFNRQAYEMPVGGGPSAASVHPQNRGRLKPAITSLGNYGSAT
ncbi:hypothetical protein [Methylobacterium sp. 190mf]|uniref:hypothetical protein n=1 Tax=Methylobacterium sp. 190mf TaxID=1761798 RepID=UPI0015E46D9E|nr:hypothetical protein [Methylobacterium sp. 190mf]